MPITLTEVDDFTTDVIAPIGGDSRAAAAEAIQLIGQSLANRSKNLNRRVASLEPVAMYSLGGLTLANDGTEYALLTEEINLGGFSIETISGQPVIRVPVAGYYMLIISAKLRYSVNLATNDLLSLWVFTEGGGGAGSGFRVHSTLTETGSTPWRNVSGSGIVQITTPATERFRVFPQIEGTGTAGTVRILDGSDLSSLILRQVG